MPNWCVNELVVTGPAAEIRRFKMQADSGEGDFSFEPFLPMPKELDTGPTDLKPNQRLKKLTGYSNWYERNCAVLGTKWDVEGELTLDSKQKLGYTFESAWAPPEEGVRRISELYPKLRFVLNYDEPGMDFAGTTIVKGGKVVSETQTKSLINKECNAEEE